MRPLCLLALLLAACAGPGQFLDRAAFDLDCPEEKLQVIDLGRNTYGVRGCGRSATYTRICGVSGMVSNGFGGQTAVTKCQWVRN
jgi:hypothetical protein